MIMMKKNFFKSYFGDEYDCNADRTKFIHNRIKLVEKYLPELGKALFDYVEKAAKSRDCSDKIALVLEEYANAENVNSDFKLQISDFANILLDVGTSRDAQVHTLETKVLENLNESEKLCKVVQSELKLSVIAGDKERNSERQLKRIRESEPQDHQQLSLAEAEYLKARGESTRQAKSLEEQMDIFERKKLNVVKEALLQWTMAELHFHTKALQLFTDAYRVAADIDVSSGVEEFRSKLISTDTTPRSESFQRSESILQLISLPFQRKAKFSGNGIPHPSSSLSSIPSSRSSSSEKIQTTTTTTTTTITTTSFHKPEHPSGSRQKIQNNFK